MQCTPVMVGCGFMFSQVDDEPFPEFTFVKECFEIHNGTINWSISKFEVQCHKL